MKVTIYAKNGAREELTNIFSVDDDGDIYTLYKCHNMCEIFSIPVDDVAEIKIQREEVKKFNEHKEG